MTEEVACVECGALVPANAARRMKGLCIPCKMKRGKANPYRVLYESLSDRVYRSPDGLETLSEPERVYFAVTLFRAEVENGGFHQYFFNSSGSYYAHAEKGLTTLAAKQTLELLRQAKEILFPAMSVPVDTETRRQVILVADPGAPTPQWLDKVNELDKRFYADSENLTSRLKTFAREQGLVSVQQDAGS